MADMETLPYHRKYRPNTLARYIGNEKLKETALKALSSGKRPQVILLWGDSGCGKAQPLDSNVLTIKGYKKMRDIKVGDVVFTHKGNLGAVSGIYPQGIRPIYRITLSDKTYIDVSDEHLNCIYLYNTKTKKREDYILTTNDLISFFNTSKYDLRVDVPSVEFNTHGVPLDSYLVGALIGDGALSSGNFNFSNSEDDILNKVDSILKENYNLCLNRIDVNKYDYRISSIYKSMYEFTYKGIIYNGCTELQTKLKQEGYPKFDAETLKKLSLGKAYKIQDRYPELRNAITMIIHDEYKDTYFRDTIRDLNLDCKSSEKFIPNEYLYNTKEVRLALLQGLFDTDGSISQNGLYEFSTTSEQLSKDFEFLVRSLGIRDTVSEKESSYVNASGERINCKTSYRHYLKVPNNMLIFTSKKHLSKYYEKQHDPIRKIVSIERIEDQECQCIMIDHPDHTYISDFFIPTHNTTFARLLAKEYSCENRTDELGACGQCMSCQVIDEYIATGATDRVTNIQEINIADQSGKRDLDAVLEDMALPSYGDEWKIYIFDECHEATSGLQNKLLKIAEEPPENVLMLFCTTNPEKMIDTLKNRCQLQLHVTKPKVKELAGLLRHVCENEQVEYDLQGLEFIANRGALTIRTALTNLQQVVTEQNSAKYENAIKVFDTVSSTIIINFFRALKAKDVFRYVTLLYEIKSKMQLSVFVDELKGFVQRGIYTINGIQQDGVSENELKVYRDLFGDLGVAQISYLLDRILSLSTNNLEIELMMLGYTGLDGAPTHQSTEVFDTEIKPIEGEVSKEVGITNKIIKENAQISYEQGVANAEKYNESASLDAILQMGGVLVED
jgi:DNA polymerase-3 subunit gamma/tau